MNLNLSELKALATVAKRDPYDHVAGNDYGMAMPPAVTLELIAEIERHRLVNAEGCKPESSILLSGLSCAGAASCRSLDKAEGEQPDLNFQLLQLAERSCSLLEDWVQHTSVSDQGLNDQIKETRELLEAQSPTWSTAVRDLLAERRRQVREEGHTLERDDQYTEGQLAQAASAYAFWADPRGASQDDHIDYLYSSQVGLYPWAKEHWKPTSQRLMLIKAGALILAEIERLDRHTTREVLP
ncbi:hypothetical protein I5P84_00290 [Pseudomonas mosselii]|uniref:hypothetical protein n=1 Tax=Pseudomonas mosselii TaxID=78327 RepID=UPI0018D88840|nr:hypothetical protein [Pseudomonas mosselii]MBH3307890.1 hypothetical protein [Pseudomonas mosselii]MBH3323030.1 hypothetical protein [Pseudomonas mosselii]